MYSKDVIKYCYAKATNLIHASTIFNRFKQKGRKIIVGEVYWKEGAEAIFDKVLPPGLVHKIISMTIGRSLPEERAYLESVAERMF